MQKQDQPVAVSWYVGGTLFLPHSILALCAYMHQNTTVVRFNAYSDHYDMTQRLAPFRKKSLRTLKAQHLVACWPLTIRMSNIVHDH